MWNADATASEGGFMDTTTSEEGQKKPARRHQSITPIVIRQVRDSVEDEFKLFGNPTQILVIVGIVKDYEVQSTKATYNVEDHTGEMKAILWLESDNDIAPALPDIKDGSYVQMFGTLRSQEHEKVLMILKIMPVDDCNIITSHLLQVIHARLQAEKLSKAPMIKPNNPGTALANSMSFISDADVMNNTPSSFTPMQQKVFKIVESCPDTIQGMSIKEILTKFPPKQHNEVKQILEFLTNEGHAYSTVDNEHFKVTSC